MTFPSRNVGIFIRSLSKGGAEKQSLLLAKYLSNYYPTTLFVLFKINSEISYNSPNNSIVFITGDNIVRKAYNFYREIKKRKIYFLFNYLPINNILGICVGKIAGVKYLFGGIRGVKYKIKSKMILQKMACNYLSTAFISNSYAAAESYINYGLDRKKILVIHNAIESVEIEKIPHNRLTILSIGRFVPEKDFITAIKSIQYLLEKYPELKGHIIYRLVGYGGLGNDFKELIRSSNLKGVIEIISNGDIGDSYKNSDILLSTSIYEGMPNVVMEAMNHALAIIATDVGDTKYLVKNGVNGYLCQTEDYSGIADKLYNVLTNDSLLNSMGKNSRKMIEENFRPEKVFSSYSKLIEDSHE